MSWFVSILLVVLYLWAAYRQLLAIRRRRVKILRDRVTRRRRLSVGPWCRSMRCRVKREHGLSYTRHFYALSLLFLCVSCSLPIANHPVGVKQIPPVFVAKLTRQTNAAAVAPPKLIDMIVHFQPQPWWNSNTCVSVESSTNLFNWTTYQKPCVITDVWVTNRFRYEFFRLRQISL